MGMKNSEKAQMWSSSSLSSSSPKSPSSNVVDIEQVWNDISIPPHLNHRASTPRVILQDFFSKESPPAAVSPPPSLALAFNSSHPHFLLNPLSVHCDAGNKRFHDSGRTSGDCRNKRMMKNRVSAARSRARKQAYTNELERQIADLRRQNAILRKEQEQLHIAAVCEQQEKKKLQRTSSAPL